MRVFQNSSLYPSYVPFLRRKTRSCRTFAEHRAGFLYDRFAAPHILKPVLDDEPNAFFTNGDDLVIQRAWANEQGLPVKTPLADILLAQIEHHRTEVFYNLDPVRYDSGFVSRLPGCIRLSIGWRAAPFGTADFRRYGYMVCNFPSIIESFLAAGIRARYFAPAHDPVMDEYASNLDRPVDVLFVGGYSRHHRRRAEVLEEVANLSNHRSVRFHLDRSRMTRLAESPLSMGLMRRLRRPSAIVKASVAPVFGRDLYQAISDAKIVLNGAIDMAGQDRGNMRCFEAMGCGAVMVSDAGRYPDGMAEGQTHMTYSDPAQALTVIERLLNSPEQRRTLTSKSREMLRERYSKERQWKDFIALASSG